MLVFTGAEVTGNCNSSTCCCNWERVYLQLCRWRSLLQHAVCLWTGTAACSLYCRILSALSECFSNILTRYFDASLFICLRFYRGYLCHCRSVFLTRISQDWYHISLFCSVLLSCGEETVQRDAAQGGGIQTRVSCAHPLLRLSRLLPTEAPICWIC